jgi:hypothetical protein
MKREAGRDRPLLRPRLYEQRIEDGKVVKDGFVGPLTGVVTRQAVGLVAASFWKWVHSYFTTGPISGGKVTFARSTTLSRMGTGAPFS